MGGGGDNLLGQIPGGGGPITGAMGVGTPGGTYAGQTGPMGAPGGPFAGQTGPMGWGYNQPQQSGFNQAQLNYIQNQGKLPAALGGGTLSGGQQNFFNAQGYLPKGFSSDLGQQYYRKPPQQQQQQYNPYGLGGGQYNPLGAGGGGPMQQLAGSNKGPG